MTHQPPPYPRTSTLIAAAVALPLLLGQASAQPPSPPSPPSAPAAPSSPFGASERHGGTLTIEFGGGTLAGYVDAVKRQSPVTVNVIVPAEAAAIPVPQLTLVNVTPFMALQALEYTSRGSGGGGGPFARSVPVVGVQITNGGPGSSPAGAGKGEGLEVKVYDLNKNGPGGGMEGPSGGSQTYAIAVMRNQLNAPFVPGAMSRGGMDAEPAVTTEVISVRDMLADTAGGGGGGKQGLTFEQIVQPIEIALNVDSGESKGGEEPPKLMVHKESNLVIVRGTPRQTALAKMVIERMRGDLMQIRGDTEAEEQSKALLKLNIEEHERRMMVLQKLMQENREQSAVLQSRIDNLRKDIGPDDPRIADTQRELERVEMQRASLQNEMLRLKMDAGSLEVDARRMQVLRKIRALPAVAGDAADGPGGDQVQALREEIAQLKKQIADMKAALHNAPQERPVPNRGAPMPQQK